MSVTLFTDLPDLVILSTLHYLSSFDAIQAFYTINNNNDRIINLLIESRCFTTIHHLRLPLFTFVCDHVLPRIGSKLSHLTLYDHQLDLAYKKSLLSSFPNLSSLHLINILEIIPEIANYFLSKQLQNLRIDLISEHHIETQAYLCEQFLFNKKSKNLIHCHLSHISGIQLQHLTLFHNSSLQKLTIQLKQLSDLHILFDNLSNIKILNVELCQWTIDDIKYDYTKLPTKLSYLIEFSFKTQHVLSFHLMLTILRYLIYLQKLSFIYRNYDECGIDINQLDYTLKYLTHLIQFEFVIKFIFFNLIPKLTFENHIQFKQRWNIHTYVNSFYKNYLAYTQPFRQQSYSVSTDILLEDKSMDFPSVVNLNLTTHTKQMTLLPLIRLLNINFPLLTHLHMVDSFGISENDDGDFKLPKIHSFNASELKISNLFNVLFQSMPNLTHLHVNLNVLMACDLKSILRKNNIKHLELITNQLDQISDILLRFSVLEQLIINSKKQSNQPKRILSRIVLDWFEICLRLYTIHVKAHKLSDLFHLIHMKSDETIHVQCWNEMFTVWR